MTMRRRRLLAALLSIGAAGASGAAPDAIEQARIERLLRFVESLTSASFVRNGKAYSCRDAARFLRAKYAKMGEHVTTAAQFIDQIASRSSTSGEVYLVRFADGRTTPAAQVLRDELARIDAER